MCMIMQSFNNKSIFLIVSIIITLSLIVHIERINTDDPLTEFYVLTEKNQAEGYPLTISVGESGVVTVGVVNHEFKDQNYILAIIYEDKINKHLITLKSSEKWEKKVNSNFGIVGDHKVEFLLFKGKIESEEPYRRLFLMFDVGERDE